jgi:fatty-acyl-CoA synthase
MAGAVINTINVRLDAPTIGFMLEHGEAKILIADREFAPVVRAALGSRAAPLIVVDIADPAFDGPGERLGTMSYEELLATGDETAAWIAPLDEWDAIALNYTSGTTGNPKGVVYHHRGAYLSAVGTILAADIPRHPIFLLAAPLFHCNGWCFPWAIAAAAGTAVCLRKVEPATMLGLMREHRVTHFGGAPIVHNLLLNAAPELWEGIDHEIVGYIAGAAPPQATIEAMERRGIRLAHVYGLTETYGPATICVRQEEWSGLGPADLAAKIGRQGVRFPTEEGLTVLNPDTMQPVPADGATMGEVMFRGNMTMKGYLNNPEATAEAFAGGWFHSGDLAVVCPDGYVQIRDRSKDVIISGGENINSLEVEEVLYRHPAVRVAAVVAQPDERWGETPCAFVEVVDGARIGERELIEHCRAHLAHFKAPKKVVIGRLPKTSTGKIQKFLLRQRASCGAPWPGHVPA